jgi:hypothetical protein
MGGTTGVSSEGAATPLRRSPQMAKLRLQVLAFVRAYIIRWGEGPSWGEIAEGTGTNRTRVKWTVRQLVAQGLLLRAPGVRGLMLPDRRDEAIRILRALGWVVDGESMRAVPSYGDAVTKLTLQANEVLDYDIGHNPVGGNGDGAQEIKAGAGKKRA